MSDQLAPIIAQLDQAQKNAVLGSAVLVPRYRDAGRMAASLVALGLAKPVLGGHALTQLGKRLRTELKAGRR